MMTTGDQVLAYLAAYDLEQTGQYSWRCNSPLRQNSNSHSFTLDLDPDGEHGTYFDHVADVGGSLYKLRDLLNLPKQTPVPIPPSGTKRAYQDLADYAKAHHVAEDVFLAAGWQNAFWFAQPALSFPTPHGARYRLIDGGKDAFIQAGGYKACLYRLQEAFSIAQASSQPLVLCNGEASTVVAQSVGVAATCQNMGEKKLTPENLKQLVAVYPPQHLQDGDVEILIAFDSDDKGRKAAPKLLEQLSDAGYIARALDLQGSDGFDLADFCGLHCAASVADLASLPDLPGTQYPQSGNPPASTGKQAPASNAQASQAQTPRILLDANLSDAGNAECLAALYPDALRFDHTRRRSNGWLAWSGQRWQIDSAGIAQRFALLTVRNRYQAAVHEQNFDRRKRLTTHAVTSENANRLRALLELAQTERTYATRIDMYDQDPMLATAINGTLELRTRRLRPADARDMITMQLGTHYDATAVCPRWEAFLREVFAGDQDLISYIQRAVGYSLTGDTSEQKLFLCHGQGANGKSVFLGTLQALFGEYAATASFHTFDAEKRSEATNDLAMLRARRLVTIIETNDDRRLDEAKVKQVTGGDPITCRFLYGEFFSYTPTFKIWMAMNYKPGIRGTDRGIWRRIALIPFDQSFEATMDRQLGAKLLHELPGILNWALAGLAAWHATGLGTCAAVDQATTAYRRESDEVGKWLTESCIDEVGAYLVSSDAYTNYNEWAKARGEQRPLTQTAWGREMGHRYPSTRLTIAPNPRKVTVYGDVRLRTMNDIGP
jgi:putative DNA primase/helicase